MNQDTIKILAGIVFLLIIGLVIRLYLFFRKEEKNANIKTIKFPELNKTIIVDKSLQKNFEKKDNNSFASIKSMPTKVFEETIKPISNTSKNMLDITKQEIIEIKDEIQIPSYPQILIPDEFLKIKNLTFEQCEFNCETFADYNPPKLYSKKELEKPLYLDEPSYKKFDAEKYKPFCVILIATSMLFGFILKINFLFGFGMLFLFFLLFGLYKIILEPFRYLNYQIELNHYKKEAPANKILWESYYDKEKKEETIYYGSVERRENYIQKFKNSLSEDAKNKIIEANIFSRKKIFFQAIRTPDCSDYKSKKGVSESKFHFYLIESFGQNNILVNQCIKGYYTNPDYHPDFVYRDSDGFYIDIEIDEPYTKNEFLEDPIAIHFFSVKKNTTVDNDRNSLFLGNNWFIIRFSEKQIVLQPHQCIAYVKNLISFIKNNNVSTFSFSNDLNKEKIWTFNEAQKMANDDYRNSYLKPYTGNSALKNLGIDL